MDFPTSVDIVLAFAGIVFLSLATQRSHIARPKSEERVVGVAAGVYVGERRNAQGYNVGAHVPAVREEGHGVQEMAGDDLQDHHRRRQTGNEEGAALTYGASGRVTRFVLPARKVGVVHTRRNPSMKHQGLHRRWVLHPIVPIRIVHERRS